MSTGTISWTISRTKDTKYECLTSKSCHSINLKDLSEKLRKVQTDTNEFITNIIQKTCETQNQSHELEDEIEEEEDDEETEMRKETFPSLAKKAKTS